MSQPVFRVQFMRGLCFSSVILKGMNSVQPLRSLGFLAWAVVASGVGGILPSS